MAIGSHTIFIGTQTFMSKLTLVTEGVRTGGGQTEIDVRITEEKVGTDGGFGTGLDVAIFDGPEEVIGEALSFGTADLSVIENHVGGSVGVENGDIVGTLVIQRTLSTACLKLASLEGTLADGSPQPARVCRPTGIVGFLTETETGALTLMAASGALAGAAPEAAERIQRR